MSIEGDRATRKPESEQRPARAIVLTLLAGFLFSTQDAAVKWLSDDYHALHLLFIRSLVVALMFLAIGGDAGRAPLRLLLAAPRPALLWLRSLLGCLAWAVYFVAVALLPLPALTTLMFTMPLWVGLLAGPLLGERVGWARGAVILLGFAGVVVMARPGSGLFGWSAVLGLVAALCYGLMVMVTRSLSRTVSSATMVTHMSLTITLLTALSLPWTWRTPGLEDLLLMLAVGVVVGAAQYALAQAYRYGAAALVAPFDYVRLLWAVAYGAWLWGDLPGGSVLAGAALVIASGLLLLLDERRRSRG